MANPYFDVLVAVEAALAAPAISGLGTPQIREIPYVLGGTDRPPLCLVCPTPEGEAVARQTFRRGVWWEYPVLVLMVWSGNRALSLNVEERLRVRYEVRQRLFVPGLSGTLTHDGDAEPEAALDAAAALGTNYAVSGFLVSYKAAEQRSA